MIDFISAWIKKLWNNRFIRFLFVGGINTLFGYGVFAFFIFMNFHYSLASLLGTVLGILFNFKTTGIIVFKNRNNTLILKFFAVYGITYLVNVLFLALFNYYHVSNYIAGAILIFPTAALSFALNHKFVFVD